MKKSIKTAMFAFAVVAAGFSGYKAYDAYTVNESTLMSANVEALSQDNGEFDAKAASKPVKSSRICYVYQNKKHIQGNQADCEDSNHVSDVCVENECMISGN